MDISTFKFLIQLISELKTNKSNYYIIEKISVFLKESFYDDYGIINNLIDNTDIIIDGIEIDNSVENVFKILSNQL